MADLKYQIKKLKKDVKTIVTKQEKFREEMKNNNATLKKESKEEFVILVERKLDDKLNIMNAKQKELNGKMSAMTQNISTMRQNLSIMTQNQNTIIKMLQKLRSSTNHISKSYMLDHYVNKNESNKIDQDNKEDKKTKYLWDDQNTNNIFDKNELDQDHNKSHADVVDN